MWLVLLSCATSPEPPKTLEVPPVPVADAPPAEPPDPCQIACERANQARAVAWEQVVADCRAECAQAVPTPAPTSYTGVVTRTIQGEDEQLVLQLPDGTSLVIREGVEVQVGREATLTADEVVDP